MKRPLATVLLALALPAIAAASSDEAWEAFREAVERSCRDLVEAPASARVTIEVNPLGSEHYGAALVTVTQDEGEDRMVCIHDKVSGRAELTAPFADAAGLAD